MVEEEKKLLESLGIEAKVENVKVNNFDINYLVTGEGPKILLIHGVNVGWGEWCEVIPFLRKNYTVIAIDLPGAGGSSRIDFLKMNFEKDFVETVEEFIKIKKIDDVTLVGHSLGGWIVLKILLRKNIKVDKAILVNPMGLTNYLPPRYALISFTAIANLLSKTVMKPTKENMEKFLGSVLVRGVELRKEFIDYFFEAVNRGKVSHPFILITSMATPFKVKDQFKINLSDLNFFDSLCIIMGEKDPIIPVSKINLVNEVFPFDFEVIPKTGHVPFIEAPLEFSKKVLRFLSA